MVELMEATARGDVDEDLRRMLVSSRTLMYVDRLNGESLMFSSLLPVSVHVG